MEKEPIKSYHKTCPFCKREHEQHDWLNIICPCGAKYYFREKYWLDRNTGEKKPS